ncbi:hypothetical protein SO802_033081 [Lithocarpus litseifolius]|uniref:Uncharacterized protein n=1 Tax=Lithocarpus litseifolius TaxID=425828 RepID=A0AAW2BC49_9ROSI
MEPSVSTQADGSIATQVDDSTATQADSGSTTPEVVTATQDEAIDAELPPIPPSKVRLDYLVEYKSKIQSLDPIESSPVQAQTRTGTTVDKPNSNRASVLLNLL